RTMTWQSDSPVNFFNVVAARWAEKRGNGTVIYYHPGHDYNVAEMSEALDAARKYFSEWFYPFPWQELKLSEFPGLSAYAQGFPTDITFSEQIGFLTKSDPRSNLAFMVTAHEAAHQWWGNILMPGEGPSGDILSEGMAHFSTILLFDQVKGPEQRIEFLKRIESRYGERRQVDSERPLVKIDGSKDGDQTVTYDKGGWVFWMLLNEMGRDSALAGNSAFIHKYAHNRDHALLPDYVEVMRGFAPDTTAYDAFVDQWFHQVVVPEYKLAGATKKRVGDTWEVTVEVTNAGTGVMPVEVAAITGERFPKRKGAPAPGSDAAPAAHAAEKESKDPYLEVRTTVRPAPGEKVNVQLTCPFEPKSILVDPDARVLQLNRKHAVAGF
ncbi:MAG TPA: M1 family aminopeptidase, partial [Candidatus Eisenbacteria bacterium]